MAQNNLGFMYENGDGAPKDYVESYKWYSLSAAQSNKKASLNISKMEKKMTEEQIAQARRRARNWHANQSANPETEISR